MSKLCHKCRERSTKVWHVDTENVTFLNAIQDLPPKDRRTVLLFYFGYLSIQEIAALSGVSTGAVKVRLHRARGQLRQHLQDGIPEWKPYQKIERRRIEMIEVHIADVIKRDDKTIVFLLDEEGNRALPIWIGQFEGAFIAAGMRGFSTPRPMTFNFMANMLQALGARLEEARVESLRGDTFYGVAKLHSGGKVVEVDARPSDVLALAALTGCPIYITEEVMEKAGRRVQQNYSFINVTFYIRMHQKDWKRN